MTSRCHKKFPVLYRNSILFDHVIRSMFRAAVTDRLQNRLSIAIIALSLTDKSACIRFYEVQSENAESTLSLVICMSLEH